MQMKVNSVGERKCLYEIAFDVVIFMFVILMKNVLKNSLKYVTAKLIIVSKSRFVVCNYIKDRN